jgi:hypothetical protein
MWGCFDGFWGCFGDFEAVFVRVCFVCVCRAVWQCDIEFSRSQFAIFSIFPLEKKKKKYLLRNGAKKKKKKKETGERETKNVLNIQLPAFRCNF